jgi:osmotically-inducible protein OsmY
MWWVRASSEHGRKDFGPEFGIDYARFADSPDPSQDGKILERIDNRLFTHFAEDFNQIEILVRNGFVILKGHVNDEATRKLIAEDVWRVEGVREVINQLSHQSN